jgi:hypothetical protein
MLYTRPEDPRTPGDGGSLVLSLLLVRCFAHGKRGFKSVDQGPLSSDPTNMPIEKSRIHDLEPDFTITPPDQISHVLSLLPDALQHAAQAIPDDYWEKTPDQLAEMIRENPLTEITTTDHRLRLSLWNEYHQCAPRSQQIRASMLYANICSKQHFYHRVLTNPSKLCWILTPPADYMQAMEECLMVGIERIRELMTIPYIDKKTGKFNSRVAELIIKSVHLLDARVKGAIVQKTLNANVTLKPKDVPQSVEEIDRQLLELQKNSEAKQIEQRQIIEVTTAAHAELAEEYEQ